MMASIASIQPVLHFHYECKFYFVISTVGL